MSEPTEIKLHYPVTVDGETYPALYMRRWKVADRVRAQRAGIDSADIELRLFADLCGVSSKVIEELDGSDYEQITEVYKGFSSTARQKM